MKTIHYPRQNQTKTAPFVHSDRQNHIVCMVKRYFSPCTLMMNLVAVWLQWLFTYTSLYMHLFARQKHEARRTKLNANPKTCFLYVKINYKHTITTNGRVDTSVPCCLQPISVTVHWLCKRPGTGKRQGQLFSISVCLRKVSLLRPEKRQYIPHDDIRPTTNTTLFFVADFVTNFCFLLVANLTMAQDWRIDLCLPNRKLE